MNSKKRILFVHHVSVVGGASYCLLSIIKELDREKYEPIVLLRKYGPLVEELKKINVKAFFCSSLWYYPYNKSLVKIKTLITIYKLYRSVSDFERCVDECAPDIVYFNNTFLFPYLRVTKKKGIKSIIHIREHWPMGEHQKQFSYIRKKIKENADAVIAINQYSAKMISSDLNDVTIVYDWIDLASRYEPISLSNVFEEDTTKLKIYLYTGGMQRIKGAFEVVSTFSKIVTDENCRLLVLGFTTQFTVKGILGLIKRFLLRIGHPTYDDKVKTIVKNDARIRCLPSVYNIKDLLDQSYCFLSYFTIPHANLAMAEAMLEGLPCIAARTEESMEYSQNGKFVELFEMNNIIEFQKCVLELNSNYLELKEKLRLHSQELKEKFSREINCRRLMSVIDSLS